MLKYAIVLLLMQGVVSHAQTQAQQSTAQATTATAVRSNLQFLSSFKSYNDLGRGREMADPAGRRVKSKNEVGAGFRSEAGFGLYVQFVETAQMRGPLGQNTFAPSDPSFTVYHPIYRNDWLALTGAARAYYPVSDFSVTNKVFQTSYYFNALAKLKNNWDFYSSLAPRYFSQPKYKPTDTTFYFEDFATFTKKMSNHFRMGIGQYTQVEAHPGTPTGFVSSTFPFVDYVVSNQVFFGPRVFFPVAANGTVFDAARQVSMNEVQAEFYLQANL